MTHPQTEVQLSVKQIIDAYGISRSTFEEWRDAAYSAVGDPPYTKSELIIILDNAQTIAARAFGASKNKNTRKIAQILKALQ
jgi:hypothetical protein